MPRNAPKSKPQFSNKQSISGTYSNMCIRLLAVWIYVKKYHPLTDLNVERWKERNIKTWYYTTNLHKGAFMLPRYVEDMLEEEEN